MAGLTIGLENLLVADYRIYFPDTSCAKMCDNATGLPAGSGTKYSTPLRQQLSDTYENVLITKK